MPDRSHSSRQPSTQVVAQDRNERGSIVLTSNKAFSEWGQVFGGEFLATAILDRLLHHCDVISITISINGPSYRRKNRLAAIEGDTNAPDQASRICSTWSCGCRMLSAIRAAQPAHETRIPTSRPRNMY